MYIQVQKVFALVKSKGNCSHVSAAPISLQQTTIRTKEMYWKNSMSQYRDVVQCLGLSQSHRISAEPRVGDKPFECCCERVETLCAHICSHVHICKPCPWEIISLLNSDFVGLG